MARIRHDGPLIIGGGLAGLSAALEAAETLGADGKVLVVTPEPLLNACSSAWAQGGMAAALSPQDSAALHAKDTEGAGAGLVEAEAARALTMRGRETVEWLAALGAPFDRDDDGGFSVSLEAAHSLPRVARVGGDGAGRAILSAVVAAARATKAMEIWEDGRLRGLIRDIDGRVRGAVIERRGGRLDEVFAPAVVLATGGIGGLFEATTNPSALRGEGLALAWQAGAEILDPEFVQFHPTAIDVGLDPAPLATEALRGEGARLVDGRGVFLLGDHPDADLAPRDIVARAVHAARVEGRGAFLDATKAVGEAFPHEFPAVFAACMRAGLDPRVSPIPVAAAAHYHMGGIVADDEGRATVPGLFAIGECAATGVHGANRLASNSLLEAGAFGRRAGRAAAAEVQPERRPLAAAQAMTDLPPEALAALRAAMTRHAGVVRDEAGLTALLALIDDLAKAHPTAACLAAARLVAEGALNRRESRGGHYRRDFPDSLPRAEHTRMRAAPAPARDEEAEAATLAALAAVIRMTKDVSVTRTLPDLLIEPVVRMALAEDLGRTGDVTAQACIPEDARFSAVFSARQAGVMAGGAVARIAAHALDPQATVTVKVADGEAFEAGAVLVAVEANARALLAAERTALNLLGRMCGIATLTRTYVQAVAGTKARIADTRKTTPGLRALEKHAVACGGGLNHRFGLDDAILIKDNHVAVCGGAGEAVRRARAFAPHLMKVEVEVDSLDQLDEVLPERPDVVMLDNFSLDDMAEAVRRVRDSAFGPVVLEASGGVNLSTVAGIAATGVDVISVGALTHSVMQLDIGLDAG